MFKQNTRAKRIEIKCTCKVSKRLRLRLKTNQVVVTTVFFSCAVKTVEPNH